MTIENTTYGTEFSQHGKDAAYLGEWACTADFHPPRKWKLTFAPFLTQMARDHYDPDLSAPQIVYQAINQLFNKHTGVLYDLDGKPIDLYAEFKDGEDVIEWAFGADWGRGMRRLLERRGRTFKNQMKSTPKLLMRILLLHYAREIRKCGAAQTNANGVPILK
ncbi:hypothetical protein [Pseudophaeobacter sp.]|uniref:hypothetical protein n=1 Tax=Pseudophaeobacter sp. TaxID=1971739 RepID=UPI0026274B3B|nr:hypothetical protein [Pseudophaeobacter sp.]